MTLTERSRRLVRLVRDEEIPFTAAGVAFYALASIVPLLILVVAALTYVGAAGRVVAVLESSLSAREATVLEELLANTRGRGVASGVGLLVTTWSGTRIFRGLSTAFARLYERDADQSVVEAVRDSVVVFAFLLVAVVFLGTVGVAVARLPVDVPYPAVVWNAVAILVLVAVLLPLYYVLPPHAVTVGQALPGAVLAAVGWVLLRFGFVFYVGNAASYAAYGILGGVLLFVTFLYLAAIVLLVGAAVNVVLET